MFHVIFDFQLQDQILFQLDVVMIERIQVLAPDLERIIKDQLKNIGIIRKLRDHFFYKKSVSAILWD